MANQLFEAPIEATKTAAWAVSAGGQIAREAGEDMLHRVRPVHATQEGVAYQAVLKEFERRLIMVNFPALDKEPAGGNDMDVDALLAADTIADHDLIDEDTPVDVRLILPEELLKDSVLNRRRARVMKVLGLAFEEEYNILALDSLPITPTERERSPTSANTVYDALAPRLDGLALQFRNDPRYKPPVMVGIIGSAYERTLFGGHGAVLGSPRGSNVMALESAGNRTENNVYAWLRPQDPLASLETERINAKMEEPG